MDCWLLICINEKVRDQIVGEELIKFAFHLNNREGVPPPTDPRLITIPQVCDGGGGSECELIQNSLIFVPFLFLSFSFQNRGVDIAWSKL